MYAITGATGNTGSLIARDLLSNGKKVRAIARNADKLNVFTSRGAEIMAGDIFNSNFVKVAFKGMQAVYCIIPPNPLSADFRRDQLELAQNYADSIVENGVEYVVILSSVGAHLRKGAGIIDGLADMEQILSNLPGVNVISLRAGYFMENVMSQTDIIKNMGILGSPLRGDLAFPIVATKDIAEVATRHLMNLDFNGFSIEYVLGPRNYTYNEIASIIGKAIGKPDLKYVQFSYEDTENAMRKMGSFSDNVLRLFTGMVESFNNGSALSDYKRTEQNSTPTTFEEFAQNFASVYEEATATRL